MLIKRIVKFRFLKSENFTHKKKKVGQKRPTFFD